MSVGAGLPEKAPLQATRKGGKWRVVHQMCLLHHSITAITIYSFVEKGLFTLNEFPSAIIAIFSTYIFSN